MTRKKERKLLFYKHIYIYSSNDENNRRHITAASDGHLSNL